MTLIAQIACTDALEANHIWAEWETRAPVMHLSGTGGQGNAVISARTCRWLHVTTPCSQQRPSAAEWLRNPLEVRLGVSGNACAIPIAPKRVCTSNFAEIAGTITMALSLTRLGAHQNPHRAYRWLPGALWHAHGPISVPCESRNWCARTRAPQLPCAQLPFALLHAAITLHARGTLRESECLCARSVTALCTTRSSSRSVAILVPLALMIGSCGACVTAQRVRSTQRA